MVCIYCAKPTRVINSRSLVRSNQVWRRRQCSACRTIFTTFEGIDLALMVQGERSGVLEPLSRDKLLISLYDSCKHRKSALNDAKALTATVLAKAFKQAKAGLITKGDLQLAALITLKRYDPVAAVHYRAYYTNPR